MAEKLTPELLAAAEAEARLQEGLLPVIEAVIRLGGEVIVAVPVPLTAGHYTVEALGLRIGTLVPSTPQPYISFKGQGILMGYSCDSTWRHVRERVFGWLQDWAFRTTIMNDIRENG